MNAASQGSSAGEGWQQNYLIRGHDLGMSSAVAAIPILLLLFLLTVRRWPAWRASLAGLAATFVLALAGYRMSVPHAVEAAAYGAAFGLFPISWIVFWAIVLYRITVETGQFEVVKQTVGAITADKRLQILLIAFAFGAFLEGSSGFGTPVAVGAAMLTGLGFPALYAATICLLANTAPVAFGAIGIPVITLAGITGLPLAKLSADVGRICAPISFLIPTYLIGTMAGMGAIREVWPALLVCGGTFAAGQFLISNYIGPQLTDILSAIATMAALMLLLQFWRPRGTAGEREARGASNFHYSKRDALRAWMPYVLLVVFVLAWGYKPIQTLLDKASFAFAWPGLHKQIVRMPPVVLKPAPYVAMYSVNWLSAAGTSCLLACLGAALVLRMSARQFGRVLVLVAKQLFVPTATVSLVLAMAFVMNYCGATGTLGLAFAASGAAFPFFSALLGWLGVFLTGSDTSANALFGSLQVVTAGKLGFSPTLIAAANSAGGVMGKMISLQTVTVAAAATGLSNQEQAKLYRAMLRHSVLLASVVGLEVLCYAYMAR